MRDLQNLLNQVSIITKKNDEFLEATGGRFNMFRVIGINHYENINSSILAELLNPKGSHGLKGEFLKVFVDQLIIIETMKAFHCETATVKTEAPGNGRIDILIEDNKGHAIIIENKIYAVDQREQLKRYDEFALERYGAGNYKIFYLTLDGKGASENSKQDIRYEQISYAVDIIQWLEQCVRLSSRYPLVRETINQYINHLKQLTNQDMDKINGDELFKILSKPENIESAIKIGENIKNVKAKLIEGMAKKVAEECSIRYEVGKNLDSIRFYRIGWKQGSGVYFASENNKTYCSLKTDKCSKGEAIPQFRIEFFEIKENPWNPYGYIHVKDVHWNANNQLFVEIADGSLAKKIIIPELKRVLAYIDSHKEIEDEL